MLKTMRFPSVYHQGRGALSRFAELAAPWGGSFLFIGSKSALAAAREPLEASLAAAGLLARFELCGGIPSTGEVARLEALARAQNPDVVCGLGGGSVLDVARAVAMHLGKRLVMLPTAAASDAPCTHVSVYYSEDGRAIVGDEVFHKAPDMILVDLDILAAAPPRLLAAGMGDALATAYEARTCQGGAAGPTGGNAITGAAVALAEHCTRQILEYGPAAMADAKNHIVTPSFERVVEANCLLSGVGGVNTGCAGAHGFGDFLAALPGGGGHFYHGERVAVGLVIQMIMEGYPPGEVARIVRFCKGVGLPASIEDLGFTDTEAAARAIAAGTENDHFVANMRCDHSQGAIYGAVLAAAALARREETP